MEFEFDKEIDALLRQARKGETAFAAANSKFKIQNSKLNHLDADEISAFAENALPEKTKQHYTVHLADCDSCRKILSSLILLNAETEGENVHAEEIGTISSATPWYKRLFAFPNLAYTMGGLILVFSGIISFVVVQNVNNSQNTEVSQISERPQIAKETSSESVIAPPESNYANTANMANTNSATVYSSNTMANTSMNIAPMNSNMNAAVSKPNVSPNTPKDEPRREDEIALSKDKTNLQADGTSAENLEERQKRAKEDKKSEETADMLQPAPTPLKPAPPSVSENKVMSELSGAKAKRNARISPETTIVAGKTFKRQDNVWYDAAYNGQSTVAVTRGTKQYKKLDKDLRVIVENLGGTVVIVWKEKAYRIQ
ncbi:MAG: hypothetical protein ACR2MG_04010 [Pyrinomonadaceae bacterium]